MAHFKRRTPRTRVRCTMCTDARSGNKNRDEGRSPKNSRKFRPSIKENQRSWGA